MRHALFIAIRPCLSILFVVCALSCAPKSVKTAFRPLLMDAQGRPSLGYLEHRGELYELRDWRLAGYDEGQRNEPVADFFPAPMIADEGSLTGLLNGTFLSVSRRINLFEIEHQFIIFGFEDTEEDQCVEIADIDGPIPAGLRFPIPE